MEYNSTIRQKENSELHFRHRRDVNFQSVDSKAHTLTIAPNPRQIDQLLLFVTLASVNNLVQAPEATKTPIKTHKLNWRNSRVNVFSLLSEAEELGNSS